MKRRHAIPVLCMAAGLMTAFAAGHQAAQKRADPVQLELTMDVATTTNDGSPAAVRFTLTNAGYSAVDLPIPAIDCSGDVGSIVVRAVVHQEGPGSGGYGHGCGGGMGDLPPFLTRVKSTWLHLRPGEYLTFTGDLRSMLDKVNGPATYTYWAEYQPPELSPKERNELNQNGYLVPTSTVKSEPLRYSQP
ncbi:MAG TPA: hypothetical protein VGR47_02015 [Terracidiphilus sp.]|nr:hypothetical protein [Terracidiphilus sp.]